VFEEVLREDRGHVLWGCMTTLGSPIIFCRTCGSFVESRSRDLTSQCKGPRKHSYGDQAVVRMFKEKHPSNPDIRVCKPWPLSRGAFGPIAEWSGATNVEEQAVGPIISR